MHEQSHERNVFFNYIFALPISQVSDDDILPKFVCCDCWAKLVKFHEFYNAVDEAKNLFLKDTVKDEEPNFIAINCDVIDFEDDIPSVKIEPMDVEVVKSELPPTEEKKSECAPIVEDANDNNSSDYFDSGNFVNCRVDSDSDTDDDDDIESGSSLKKESTATAKNESKEDNVPACASRAAKKNRTNKKKKKNSSKMKSKSRTKTSATSAAKNVVSETDFQFASKYIRINCELCDYPFESLTSARAHCRSKHDSTAKFVCCKRRLRIYNINDHLQYHLNPDVYK